MDPVQGSITINCEAIYLLAVLASNDINKRGLKGSKGDVIPSNIREGFVTGYNQNYNKRRAQKSHITTENAHFTSKCFYFRELKFFDKKQ